MIPSAQRKDTSPMRRLRALAVVVALLATAAGCYANPTETGPGYDPGPPATFTDDPAPGPEDCTTTASGEYEVTVDGTVVDGLCLNPGVVVIRADNVHVRNSQITGRPVTASECDPQTDPEQCIGYGATVITLEGADGAQVYHNLLDCGGDTTPFDNAASVALAGSMTARRNEIRDCSDGIQTASNSTYAINYIHSPDNCDVPGVCDLHADGVQGSTNDDGSHVHDVVFEWNTVEFPGASAAFQYHAAHTAAEGWENVVVRYNAFRGGGYAVRFPDAGNGGLEFYGNRIANYAGFGEFGLCTVFNHGTDPIDVWGTETGDPTDSLDRGIPDDANIDEGTGAVIEREDCE